MMPRRVMRSARSWKIGARLGALAARALVEDVDDLLQVRRLARRPQELPHLVVVGHQADGVLLVQDQVGQRGGGHAGVVVLADQRLAVAADGPEPYCIDSLASTSSQQARFVSSSYCLR